jgi:hypothetical protein
MLKRIIHINLIFVFLFSTTGITVYSHYCSGHLIEKSVYVNTESCCNGLCSSCYTDIITAKITDAFIGSKFSVDFTEIVKSLLDHNKIPVIIKSRMHDISWQILSSDEVFVWLLHPLIPSDRNTLFCIFLT